MQNIDYQHLKEWGWRPWGKVKDVSKDYQLVQDSQDIKSIEEHFPGIEGEFECFFVLIGEGEYEKVLGCHSYVPYPENEICEIIPFYEIDWDTFVEKYKPIQNTIYSSAPFDGFMFETFDRELAEVNKYKKENIWTLMDDNEGEPEYIQNGPHIVNRLGYFITEVPWEGEVTVLLETEEEFPEEGGESNDEI